MVMKYERVDIMKRPMDFLQTLIKEQLNNVKAAVYISQASVFIHNFLNKSLTSTIICFYSDPERHPG